MTLSRRRKSEGGKKDEWDVDVIAANDISVANKPNRRGLGPEDDQIDNLNEGMKQDTPVTPMQGVSPKGKVQPEPCKKSPRILTTNSCGNKKIDKASTNICYFKCEVQ